jgi:hypothetical protein
MWCAGAVLAGSGLFALYLRQAQTWRIDADAAADALQAQDMLHGNLLLHGWWLGDATYYTTELPEYMLVGKFTGINPSLVHVSAALTYTLLVLLAAALAKDHARGREGIVRALLAAGIMLSPGVYLGTNALLGTPDHTGTGAPVLLILLLLDRAENWKRRWYVPVAACLLLAWAQLADQVVIYAAAAPLALVGGGRAMAGIVRRRSRHQRTEWSYDLSLTAAAAASVPLASGSVALIHSHGGYSVAPVSGPLLASLAAIPSHALAVGQSVLVLFGADFFGQPTRTGAVLALVHLVGVAVVALALLAGIFGFFRLDRISQVLVVGTLIMLGAGVFSTHVANISFAHEIAIVLPFGAVLAGRLLAGPLIRVRLEPLLAAGLAAYLGSLFYFATLWTPGPPQNQAAADWLVTHGFTSGLAWYWQADSITFDSGGRVRVAPLIPGTTTVYRWEADAAWYDARSHYANFVITEAPSAVFQQAFGRPAQVYHYQHYTIMVWRKNLLPLVSGGGG